ncbi:nucleotidyltransferase domain-containing protein [Dethiobacter alkaliphilus]|uniref:Polymerase beta nucleotidyltransferase domain-containing protein n=1 Tax=Dethiobacter alkaliphilus AHT 1 TaxID=555088 RepID=C0GHT3_DETAL|nr:nucleotidyltransferase domain-containing protein [Dethiobacter alkaliphilus]EEG77007.1 hypothetical protein DealDRAFT_2042 [Dethiobacter alkaliphilus AHT 1]
MERMDHQANIMEIMAEAVRFGCRKEQLAEEQFLKKLLTGDVNAHSRLRYALAKGISRYLGSMDDNLESVYVYGSTMNDNAGFSSDIDLIVKVKSKNGKTRRAFEILDSFLRISYKILLADDELPIKCMLDVQLVDQRDIEQKINYGSVISSHNIVPVKVWSRETATVPA